MLTIRALASGSSGNAFLVETPETVILLDAGLGTMTLQRHIRALGIEMAKIQGIMLTHEHSDHIRGAMPLSTKFRVPLYATPGTIAALGLASPHVTALTRESRHDFSGLSITPFTVRHDAAEPVGLLISYGDTQVVLATDVGSVDTATAQWLAMADLLILDTNHDTTMLRSGPYPEVLKRRIASANGHLSNVQSADAIGEAASNGRVRAAWLAHLSETNNSRVIALDTVKMRLAGIVPRIEVVGRHVPSLVWRSSDRIVQGRLL